jgi:ABC-type branched-subunit amino acid transport system ATPase component
VGSWFDYTTLFNLITGHDVPDSGRIVFEGRDATGPAPERVAALGMARTFQHAACSQICPCATMSWSAHTLGWIWCVTRRGSSVH